MAKDPTLTPLEEAVNQLRHEMTTDEEIAFSREPKDYPGVRFHFTSGMAMRNEWGLWHGKTPLSKWLRAHGVFHGDDQSAVIYKALWRRLNGLALSEEWLADEAERYALFWARSGLTWDQKPIPGWKPTKDSRWFKMTEGGGMEEIDG